MINHTTYFLAHISSRNSKYLNRYDQSLKIFLQDFTYDNYLMIEYFLSGDIVMQKTSVGFGEKDFKAK